MLKLIRQECFDLNTLGFIFVFILFIFAMFYSLPLSIILAIEILLGLVALFLFKQLHSNKYISILINTENQWFVESAGETTAVQLKDYWVFSGLIFFWLKGEKNSVSFVVTRSIIGAPKFSQLRAKIL
jgi:c-di-AMP phosphodiesterase-like protein